MHCFFRMGIPPCQLAPPILGKTWRFASRAGAPGRRALPAARNWACISAPDAAMIRAFHLQARARAGRAATGIPEER